MSADLFAEFNSLQDNQTSQQSASQLQQPQSTHFQNSSQNKDSVDFLGSQGNRQSNTQPLNPWSSFASQTSATTSWSNQQWPAHAPSAALADEDDDFGDFETATPQPQVQAFPPPRQPQTTGWQAPPVTQNPSETRPGITRAPTTEIMGNGLADLNAPFPQTSMHSSSYSSWDQEETLPRPTLRKGSDDPNVLFDADDFELQGGDDDDDGFNDDTFGDFETVAQPPKQSESWVLPQATTESRQTNHLPISVPVTAPSLDLLSLDDPPPVTTPEQPQASQPRSVLSFGADGTLIQSQAKALETAGKPPRHKQPTYETKKVQKPKASNKSISELPKPQVNDEDWGVWDDFANASPKASVSNPAQASKSWEWEPSAPTQSTMVDNDVAPPINVPPPSVILSAFLELFATVDALFKPISGQPSIKDRVLSNPKAIEFLQGYILLAATAGRVIAGRKQRWHRDKILAKSMSISAAGSKGMKLAGVDKTQSAREDREAEDLATAWKGYIGRVRSAVIAVNSTGNSNLKVPELSSHMLVHTAKGALTSPKPCIICGLKRDERVTKVDFEVEDSFGEWWTEHWGHRACKNFWIEHEQRLRQR